MIISSATPQEIVNWFHTDDHQQELLCIALATSADDRQKLSDLIEEFYQSDAALGDRVAFLILHPEANTPIGIHRGLGRYSTFRGDAYPTSRANEDRPRSLREMPLFRDMSDEGELYRSQVARESAKAMALIAPEFMRLLEVDSGDLPAICVLVKGMDDVVVVPLGRNWTPADLRDYFQGVRRIVERRVQSPLFRSYSTETIRAIRRQMAQAEEKLHAIEARIRKIGDAFNSIANRHTATARDRSKIADFLSQGVRSQEALTILINGLSFRETEKFFKDSQIGKVFKLTQQVQVLRDELHNEILSDAAIGSVLEQARQIEEESLAGGQ
jgi:hypothetical protein